MEIKKKKGTFNTYICELSFGQLLAFRNGLASDHADPLADEAYAELNWYLDNVPGPGEEEEDLKREEEATKSGLGSPEAEGQPLNPRADDLLPAPDEDEGGGEQGAPPGPESEPEGTETPPGADEGPDAGPGPEEGPSPEEYGSETDRRLPPPPRK